LFGLAEMEKRGDPLPDTGKAPELDRVHSVTSRLIVV
jgi:hypothetical protein